MKLAVSTGFYHLMPHEELLQIASACGCRNLELLMNKAFADLSDETIISAIRKYGLSVSSIHAFPRVWEESYVDDEAEGIERALGKLGTAFNIDLVVSHMILIKKNGQYFVNDDNHKRTIRHFNQIQKLPITTENMPPFAEKPFLMYLSLLYDFLLVDDLPLTFDTTHCGFCKTDLISSYELFKPFIRNIHISDFSDGNEHLIPGTGALPLKQFIKHIKADGYSGQLTIELDFASPGPGCIKDPEKVAESLRQAVEYVSELM